MRLKNDLIMTAKKQNSALFLYCFQPHSVIKCIKYSESIIIQ